MNRFGKPVTNVHGIPEVSDRTWQEIPTKERQALHQRKGDRDRRRRGLSKESLLHGTMAGYSNHACRCDQCKAAQRKKYYEDKKRKASE
jgi:hypothetical protein